MLSHLQKYTPTPNTYTYNSLLRLCSQTSTGLKVKLTALMFIPLEFFSVVNLKETCPQQETFFSRSCHPQKGFHSCVQQCLTFICGARNSITLNKPRRSEAYTLITGNSISHRDKKNFTLLQVELCHLYLPNFQPQYRSLFKKNRLLQPLLPMFTQNISPTCVLVLTTDCLKANT